MHRDPVCSLRNFPPLLGRQCPGQEISLLWGSAPSLMDPVGGLNICYCGDRYSPTVFRVAWVSVDLTPATQSLSLSLSLSRSEAVCCQQQPLQWLVLPLPDHMRVKGGENVCISNSAILQVGILLSLFYQRQKLSLKRQNKLSCVLLSV